MYVHTSTHTASEQIKTAISIKCKIKLNYKKALNKKEKAEQ